tara:strand:- start:352 stop:627 length:276 start_codon:yes stop_codon:yes gene_type:complete
MDSSLIDLIEEAIINAGGRPISLWTEPVNSEEQLQSSGFPEIHSTQGSTEIETIYVRITSMDLTNITRHRYDVKSGRSRSFSAHDARTTRK